MNVHDTSQSHRSIVESASLPLVVQREMQLPRSCGAAHRRCDIKQLAGPEDQDWLRESLCQQRPRLLGGKDREHLRAAGNCCARDGRCTDAITVCFDHGAKFRVTLAAQARVIARTHEPAPPRSVRTQAREVHLHQAVFVLGAGDFRGLGRHQSSSVGAAAVCHTSAMVISSSGELRKARPPSGPKLYEALAAGSIGGVVEIRHTSAPPAEPSVSTRIGCPNFFAGSTDTA